jgi:hypothetical protein
MRTSRSADIRWLWLFLTAALTAIVIAFGRYRSNERVARAIAAGVARRRDAATERLVPIRSRQRSWQTMPVSEAIPTHDR